MQSSPVNPADMVFVQQIENNSGSSFFAIAVLIVIVSFFVYSVILPKFKKSDDNVKNENSESSDTTEGGE